jgi:hypothetical protein
LTPSVSYLSKTGAKTNDLSGETIVFGRSIKHDEHSCIGISASLASSGRQGNNNNNNSKIKIIITIHGMEASCIVVD